MTVPLDRPSRIAAEDPEAWQAFEAEADRQANTLEMIASENHASPAVMEACGSLFTNKYAEGYPGHRYYGGCRNMDVVEQLAIDRARGLFGAEHANVQPHSGAQANIAVYLAALEAGDTILSLDLASGGHLTHGMRINFSGLFYHIVSYRVEPDTGRIDMDAVARLAREHRPKLLVTGASAYPRTLDFARFQEIADEVGAVQMADIAHIAGMVAVGLHPSPVPYAQYVTTTTHKTLRGPRGGMILCREALGREVDSSVFPGAQGGPLMHIIAAKAVALGEALRPAFKAYQQQTLDNAQALAETLVARGHTLTSGGTDNHLMLVDLRGVSGDLTGKTASTWMEEAAIVTNKNVIPGDPRKPTEASGIRLGTPAATTRGLRTDEMRTVGDWIDRVLRSGGDRAVLDAVAAEVRQLCQQFPLPH